MREKHRVKRQEGRSQHMSTTTEHIGAARAHRPTIGTLRLRLKPAHRSCGFVQGGWWPQSTSLTVELPSLLKALSLRFGTIARVRYLPKRLVADTCDHLTPSYTKGGSGMSAGARLRRS